MSKKRSRAPWKRPRRGPTPSPKAETSPASSPSQAADPDTLARLAENVWRLKRRVDGETSRDWAESIIAGLNHDLESLGVEVIDRTGTPFSNGETTEVVHNEAPADWQGKLAVTEVIRPTIRVSGTIVQPGQVVLGADDS